MEMPESSAPAEMQGWWTPSSPYWPEVSEYLCGAWHRQERAKSKLPSADAEVALAFGFTGRLFYGEHRDWSELTDQLALDWSAAGFEFPWKQARPAVKAGWTFAREQGQADEQAKREVREAHDVELEHADHLVHGGRMVDHGT